MVTLSRNYYCIFNVLESLNPIFPYLSSNAFCNKKKINREDTAEVYFYNQTTFHKDGVNISTHTLLIPL